MANSWYPRQTASPGRAPAAALEAEALIIIERRAHRVLERRELDPADWDGEDLAYWAMLGRPDPATWPCRPLVLVVRDEIAPAGAAHYTVHARDWFYVLPDEHFAVCRVCGEIPPCRHREIEAAMAQERRRFERIFELRPGCCHACGQPVTGRQRQIRFEGANLIRPDLPDGSVIFHSRRACLSAARRYDDAWARAQAGRRRKLSCPGHLTIHHGGRRECTEAELCPGEVTHASCERHEPGPLAACSCVAGTPPTRGAAHEEFPMSPAPAGRYEPGATR